MKTLVICGALCLIVCFAILIYGIDEREHRIEELRDEIRLLQLRNRLPPPEVTIQFPLNGTNVVHYITNIYIPNVISFKLIPIL